MGFWKKIFGGKDEGDGGKKQVVIPTIESSNISAADVKAKIDSGENVILVDVREDYELQQASISGALHIPMGDIHSRYKEISDDPHAEVIVFCHHGHRSEQVMTQLWGLGYQNSKTMEGGIEAWSEQVDPTVPKY